MRPMLFLAALAMMATTAFASGEMPSFKDFKEYNAQQMRALPDVKVKLGKRLARTSLVGLGETELVLMKNSIYAQAGYSFKAPYLKRYFESRSWYRGGRYERSKLKSIDRENADVIGHAISKAKKKHHGDNDGDGYDGYDGYDGNDGYDAYGYGGENT